jgi:adenosylhomocysteine nucleosidase
LIGVPHTIAVVGLAFEARIAAGPGVAVVGRATGHDIGASLHRAVSRHCRGIISFGIAGGLVAGLKPGAVVVASSIVERGGTHPTDALWSERLLEVFPKALHAPIAGSDIPVGSPQAKRELHCATGAAAVDMESHIAARFAAAHGLGFTALRVVADPAARALPQAAMIGMRADGSIDHLAVLRALLRRWTDVPALVRVARDTSAARATLRRGRRLLGPGFGLLDVV